MTACTNESKMMRRLDDLLSTVCLILYTAISTFVDALRMSDFTHCASVHNLNNIPRQRVAQKQSCLQTN